MENKRLLIISDDQDLSTAYRSILAPKANPSAHATSPFGLEPQFTDQGEPGLLLLKKSMDTELPFAAVFIIINNNSSWDGLRTATEIRKTDPNIEIALICPDQQFTTEQIVKAVAPPERLLFLRNPAAPDEFLQLAHCLTSKWSLTAKTTILDNSQTRFHELTTANRQLIWEINTDGNFTYCSPSCEAVYGYKPEELLGENIFNRLVPPDEINAQQKLFTETISRKKSLHNVHRKIISRSGKIIYVDTTCIPLLKNGKVIACRGLDRDVTEMKNLELQLELKTMELTEVNNALKILLKQSTEAIAEHERKIYDNLQRLVFPYFDKLATKEINQETELYINVIRTNLEKITSTFNLKVSSKLSGLTPRELQVAELIKQGKSTKEMSTLLGLSSRTIEFYRDKLRVKLNIKMKKVNLRSHLASIS
ncbi:MAG: PAS domain S-box protein [Desulfobulbaceae bacterium]|nr:PAS domain S-box protein [Desulfobulbaceae bacterium]HIJ78663.1 PAS domain S-box protein [Deltaproteobacteria bacterium]